MTGNSLARQGGSQFSRFLIFQTEFHHCDLVTLSPQLSLPSRHPAASRGARQVSLIGLVADKEASDFRILISCRFSRPVASPTGFLGRALCERERRERSSYEAARVIHLPSLLLLGKFLKYRRRHRLRPRRPFVSAAICRKARSLSC